MYFDDDKYEFHNYGIGADDDTGDGCVSVQRNATNSYWNSNEFIQALSTNPDYVLIGFGTCDSVTGVWNQE